MPVNWTAEKNAKLFLGVLEQCKEQSLKLNYRRLAEYMGPDCTWKAIEGQIAKLKKNAAVGQDPNEQSASAPSTPAATPRKRAAGGTPAKSGSPQKKKKAKSVENNTDDDSEAEKQALKEVRQELEEQKK
ncbi:hypothetical protein ASPCAL05987 [Aspergillus calidoustus]|uniref:Uncharacterized protein n=1 Tax=Aspergillus calidoustus TaxID=454130 RepID=A0A0U5G5P5_ASPCI|nr:hypothetical protein ASPCAL05987 [Aspergillus calidoustus]